jgi:hypothetical protein
LQHDLWAVFDWLVKRENNSGDKPQKEISELEARLATAIHQVALTREQIAALPDNYAAAVAAKTFPSQFEAGQGSYLPKDLFAPDGPWICLERNGDLSAPVHTRSFGGRSAFMIFLRLPDGRKATLDYMERLAKFPEQWIFA